jgi:hypothetical protein
MPSYIGWKSDRPTLRHFVLPSETALTRDEFNQKNIKIAKDELFELYKLKLLLDQYIYNQYELEKHTSECKKLEEVLGELTNYIFKNNTLYDGFMEMYKENMKKVIEELFKQRNYSIGETDLKNKKIDVITNMLSLGKGKGFSKFLKANFIVKLKEEKYIFDKLQKKIDASKITNYMSYLKTVENNLASLRSKYQSDKKTDILKYLKKFDIILKNYDKISDKERDDIIEKMDKLCTSFIQISGLTADTFKEINLMTAKIKRVKETSEEIYQNLKTKFTRGFN